MAIDITKEKTFKISDARAKHPDLPCYSTLKNWIRKGIKDRQGRYVKLEAVRMPGGHHTSYEAYLRFIAALNAEPPGEPDPVAPPRDLGERKEVVA